MLSRASVSGPRAMGLGSSGRAAGEDGGLQFGDSELCNRPCVFGRAGRPAPNRGPRFARRVPWLRGDRGTGPSRLHANSMVAHCLLCGAIAHLPGASLAPPRYSSPGTPPRRVPRGPEALFPSLLDALYSFFAKAIPGSPPRAPSRACGRPVAALLVLLALPRCSCTGPAAAPLPDPLARCLLSASPDPSSPVSPPSPRRAGPGLPAGFEHLLARREAS